MRTLLVILLAVLSVAIAAPVATISASAKFKDLKPSQGDTYQYLYYVTNSSWTPAQYRWNCNNGPNTKCSSGCGTENANGPQCLNPTVPANAPFNLMLETFPWQVRWGDPVPVGDDGGSGLPSGFGFRGTVNQGIDNIYQKFWVGEAVHFNNPIWASGGNSDSWTLVITLYIVDANGASTTQDFSYALRLDETLNDCSENDGCPWTSDWWAAQPSTVDTRADCPALTETPRLPPAPGSTRGKKCCRYITQTDLACADRVWTLDALDRTQVITVGAKRYTLNIKGFSVPGNDAVQKDYFISQEKSNTRAEIYATLIDACPESCPSGQVIVQGTTCSCQCPASTCGPKQYQNASCACVCNANAIQCNTGSIKAVGNDCQCECAAVNCGSVKFLNATDCSCYCPANICGAGQVSNPNDPFCPCQCPTCPPGQVSNLRCAACACPAGAQAACENANPAGVYNSATCKCSICSCPVGPCKPTPGQCLNQPTDVECTYDVADAGDACLPGDDKCIARCGPNGECIYDAINCVLDIAIIAEDAVCYSVNCTDGSCLTTFHEGKACSLAALDEANVNTPCLQAVCRVNKCVAEAIPGVNGTACPLSSDDQCNGGRCINGACTNVPLVDQPCSDGLACTYLAGFVDPVTNGLSDACKLGNNNIATCTNDSYQCSDISIACHTIQCLDTAVGAFCQATPVPFNSSCDDGTQCTVGDVCQRQLEADPDTGEIAWVDNGVCEGYTRDCSVDDPCIVGRCLEGGGCVNRTDVRDGFICGVSADNCTIFRCDNGSCLENDDLCGGGVSKGAIAGAAVAGAAAIALAVAIGLFARNRIANSKVFDPTTWEQLQAGAGTNNAIYERRNTEVTNQLYQN